MNPIDNPGAYDALRIAGKRTPGQLKWTSPPKVDEGWEKKEAKGSKGGETICNGRKICEFAVELYLWRDTIRDEFAAWEAFKPVLAKTTKDGAAQQALDIYSPVLEEAGISAVVLKNVPCAIPDGKGGATVLLEFMEYRPAKKNSGSGKPKGAAAAPGAKADPFADLNATIANNNAEIQLLSSSGADP